MYVQNGYPEAHDISLKQLIGVNSLFRSIKFEQFLGGFHFAHLFDLCVVFFVLLVFVLCFVPNVDGVPRLFNSWFPPSGFSNVYLTNWCDMSALGRVMNA